MLRTRGNQWCISQRVDLTTEIVLSPYEYSPNRALRLETEMTYEERVQAIEAEGICRSDAQGMVDAEDYLATGSWVISA